MEIRGRFGARSGRGPSCRTTASHPARAAAGPRERIGKYDRPRSFEAWGIGRQGKDDGLALFVFSQDRALRLEVGYRLEGMLTDAATSRVIQQVAIPRLKAGDPDGAEELRFEELRLQLPQRGRALRRWRLQWALVEESPGTPVHGRPGMIPRG
jgi:hypothetical protein